jgi:hypothetical protein
VLRLQVVWRRIILSMAVTCGLALAICASGRAAEKDAGFAATIQPLLKTYCFECHAEGASEGNFSLDEMISVSAAKTDPEAWWKVLKNVRAGVMPPKGSNRPSKEEIATLSNWIKFEAFGISRENPDPGRTVIRRLNRSEYGSTISDLMGIPFDAAVIFPPDDSGHGFDNVGDALSVSPLLLEKYVRSAQMVVDRAVPKQTWIMPYQEFVGGEFRPEKGDARGNNLPGKTAHKVSRNFEITDAGQYEMEVSVKLHGSFEFDPARYNVIFYVDGQERSRNEYGWDENKLQQYTFKEEWTAGKHELRFELEPIKAEPKPDDAPNFNFNNDPKFVRFEIVSVRIEGPAGTEKRVHPKGYERFFSKDAPPGSAEERRAYAQELLERFAKRAFRSTVDQATLDRLVRLTESVYSQPGKTFEEGVGHGMIAVLASPRFLFRLEGVMPTSAAVPISEVSELALASRLSYFLWSTMPDEELLSLAEAGELRANLHKQVDRMLRHPKGAEFVRNFAGQWLRTRDVTQISIDPIVVLGHQEEFEKMRDKFRERRARPTTRELSAEDQALRDRFRELRALSDRFDADLRRAIRRETELCVEHLAKENGSLLDLLDCDYTFLNEKLAELYGISGVRGGDMRRVELPADSPRGGVLTQASMLLVTSNPTRTSPVKRGLFVLENVLGTPSPPPPPNVPELEEAAKQFAGREPTLREVLAAHREKAICTSCHARMDPLGLALENFNALGMWRDEEKGQPIDATGELITGEKFADIRELKKILRQNHAEDFYRCLAQKMLTFALGRGLEYSDEHHADLIVEKLLASGGKFNDLIYGVVDSATFQKQRNPSSTSTQSATNPDSHGANP